MKDMAMDLARRRKEGKSILDRENGISEARSMNKPRACRVWRKGLVRDRLGHLSETWGNRNL